MRLLNPAGPRAALPPHLFASEDGTLYDTRRDVWSARPLRVGYRQHVRDIMCGADLRRTLRAGAVAWPRCLPLVLWTADGEPVDPCALLMSASALRTELARIAAGDRSRIVSCDVHWEGPPLTCSVSGRSIPSAYGDPSDH